MPRPHHAVPSLCRVSWTLAVAPLFPPAAVVAGAAASLAGP